MENRAVDSRLWRVFGWPITIGLVSLVGLVTALLSADFGRYLGWMAVASPLIAILWFRLRQFRSAK